MVMSSYSLLGSLFGLLDIMINAGFIFNKRHKHLNLPQTYSKKQ